MLWIAENFVHIVVGIMILISLAVLFSWIFPGRKRRAAALSEISERIGFTHQKEVDFSFTERFGAFALFQIPGSENVYNYMQGKTPGGRAITIFDYEYHQFQDKDSDQTVAMFKAKGQYFPAFSIRPANEPKLSIRTLRKLQLNVTQMMKGYQSVDFSYHRGFNKVYRIKTPDRKESVLSLFTAEKIHHLTQKPGWNIEGYGSRLIIYHHDQLMKPENLQDFIGDCEALAQVFIPS